MRIGWHRYSQRPCPCLPLPPMSLLSTRQTITALTLATALMACDKAIVPAGEPRTHGGTVVVGITTEPASLLPPLVGSDHETAISEVVYDRLADIGAKLETVGDAGFTPRLASAWTWSADSMSIAFTLDERARWHDGEAVTSEDVRTTFALYTDPRVESRNAALLSNIDSVSTPDERTATFWFKRRYPQQFYDAAYHLFIMPSHLLRDADPTQLASVPLARSPVGTGRFRFNRWTPGQRIELVSDTGNFRGRASLDRVVFTLAPDFGAAIVTLFTGELDFFLPLRTENIEQASRTSSVRVLAYPTLRYQQMTLNQRDPRDRSREHPVLGDVAVRRALTMAANRERIVRTVFDSIGQVAIGPATRVSLPGDSLLRQLPFDVAAARALLDSAGWVPTGSEGVREKGGVRLRVEVLVPSISVTRDRMAVLLQDQLRAIGAELVLRRIEVNALIERIESGRFDAYMGGFTASPGHVGLRQTWSTRGIGDEGFNYGGYSSAVFDANVDSALTSFDRTIMQRALLRAVQTIIDDAPAIWLVEDGTPAGIHVRIDPGVIPVNGWWHGLPDWRIPPAQRIARDRVGIDPAN